MMNGKVLSFALSLALAGGLVCGCRPRGGKGRPGGAAPPPKSAPAKPGQPERPGIVSEVQQTVDGMAGGAAFRAGQNAKKKIQGIQQQQQQRMLDD